VLPIEVCETEYRECLAMAYSTILDVSLEEFDKEKNCEGGKKLRYIFGTIINSYQIYGKETMQGR
jgi:hypothetical protein